MYPVFAGVDVRRSPFRMDDTATGGHPIDITGPDRLFEAEAVAMHNFALEQIRHGGEADMRVGAHIDALAGWKTRGAQMIEKDKRSDGTQLGRR